MNERGELIHWARKSVQPEACVASRGVHRTSAKSSLFKSQLNISGMVAIVNEVCKWQFRNIQIIHCDSNTELYPLQIKS